MAKKRVKKNEYGYCTGCGEALVATQLIQYSHQTGEPIYDTTCINPNCLDVREMRCHHDFGFMRRLNSCKNCGMADPHAMDG